MVRLLALLTLFAVCACDQQSPYSSYYPYQQNSYPYDQGTYGQGSYGGYRSPYAGGPRQQGPAAGTGQVQRWSYPDGSVRYGVYDPNTGTMR